MLWNLCWPQICETGLTILATYLAILVFVAGCYYGVWMSAYNNMFIADTSFCTYAESYEKGPNDLKELNKAIAEIWLREQDLWRRLSAKNCIILTNYVYSICCVAFAFILMITANLSQKFYLVFFSIIVILASIFFICRGYKYRGKHITRDFLFFDKRRRKKTLLNAIFSSILNCNCPHRETFEAVIRRNKCAQQLIKESNEDTINDLSQIFDC
ncbi:MAG TPA: hypothetical protein VMW67_08045 [Desulfobacteria bacterium]|nr:hypothetical protein [Desulfobacteria bacterium]